MNEVMMDRSLFESIAYEMKINDAEIMEAAKFKAFDVDREIKIISVVRIGIIFLVEDEDGDWWMGESTDEKIIHCWGNYGDIKSAIEGM